VTFATCTNYKYFHLSWWLVHIPWTVYAQCHCKTTLVTCLLLSHTVPSSADTRCEQLANFQDIVGLLTNWRVTTDSFHGDSVSYVDFLFFLFTIICWQMCYWAHGSIDQVSGWISGTTQILKYLYNLHVYWTEIVVFCLVIMQIFNTLHSI
jgi:hypothetical protein